jgi:hypothetical protein
MAIITYRVMNMAIPPRIRAKAVPIAGSMMLAYYEGYTINFLVATYCKWQAQDA